ncbi:MAG TPA: RICIN domain-containing protein, partial [Polyangia bacterium]
PNYAYDWRLGVPSLTQLIALRLQLMGMEDPSFTSDGRFNAELMSYHDALVKQLEVMRAGIRCNAFDVTGHASGPNPTLPYTSDNWYVSCADIYTGVNETWAWSIGADEHGNAAWYAANVQPKLDQARRDLTAKLPLFGVQAMVDTLYLYAHPATELTRYKPQIEPATNGSLCLDVRSEQPVDGTPVLLWPCASGLPGQQWHYDREQQTIVNTAFNKCLDVRGGSPLPGTIAEIWPCVAGDDAQRWTYSFEDDGLRNAAGNALQVSLNYVVGGESVVTWPFDPSYPAERWVSPAFPRVIGFHP